MVSIYVLKLESNKFYIGKTNNDPEVRFAQHCDEARCTEWMKMYKPIEIIKTYKDCDDFDEDKHTLKYMSKYGIDNVRGGSFCEVNLPQDNISTIKKMIRGSNNRCFTCGSNEHFANKCNAPKDTHLDDSIASSDSESDPESSCKHSESLVRIKSPKSPKPTLKSPNKRKRKREEDEELCYRCGRNNHCTASCYATYHRNGKKLKRLKINE